MTATQQTYEELIRDLRDVALLESCASVLGWDEQTYLPPAGVEHRANQMSLLAGLCHERATSPRIGELLSQLEETGDLGGEDSAMAVNVREARRQFDRSTKLPRRLVEEMSRVASLAQQSWVGARKEKKFAPFLPWLEQVIALKREEAEAAKLRSYYEAKIDYFRALSEMYAQLRERGPPLSEGEKTSDTPAIARMTLEAIRTKRQIRSVYPQRGRERVMHLLVLEDSMKGDGFMKGTIKALVFPERGSPKVYTFRLDRILEAQFLDEG